MKKKIFFLVAAVFLVCIVSFVFINRDIQKIKAEVPLGNQELYGWVWSDTVGWISFNCNDPDTGGCVGHDYQVSVNPNDGKFSGYAWSERIGWIKFFEDAVNDLNNDPDGNSGGVILQNSNYYGIGEVIGWARACVAAPNQATCSGNGANVNSGGWDGWIKMNHGMADQVNVNLEDGKFHKYAWGSDVVGWLQFDSTGTDNDVHKYVDPAAVTVNISANPSCIRSGESSVIDWNAPGATSCIASNGDPGWPGNRLPSDPSYTTPLLNTPTIYNLKCMNLAGYGIGGTTVTILDKYFSLSADPNKLKALFIGEKTITDTSTITITVNPACSSIGAVNISVVQSSLPIGAEAIFDSDPNGISTNYGTVKFNVNNVPNTVMITPAIIIIRATDTTNPLIYEELNIPINARLFDPDIIEIQ